MFLGTWYITYMQMYDSCSLVNHRQGKLKQILSLSTNKTCILYKYLVNYQPINVGVANLSLISMKISEYPKTTLESG